MRAYFVYLLSSRSRALYTGVTNDLVHRLSVHKSGVLGGHTAKYRITMLVYFEVFDNITAAISREKQIKRWTRAKKYSVIEMNNPDWRDLSINLSIHDSAHGR